MKNELLEIAAEMWRNADTADPDYIRGFATRVKELAEKIPDNAKAEALPSEQKNETTDNPPPGDPEDGNGGDHPTKRPGNP